MYHLNPLGTGMIHSTAPAAFIQGWRLAPLAMDSDIEMSPSNSYWLGPFLDLPETPSGDRTFLGLPLYHHHSRLISGIRIWKYSTLSHGQILIWGTRTTRAKMWKCGSCPTKPPLVYSKSIWRTESEESTGFSQFSSPVLPSWYWNPWRPAQGSWLQDRRCGEASMENERPVELGHFLTHQWIGKRTQMHKGYSNQSNHQISLKDHQTSSRKHKHIFKFIIHSLFCGNSWKSSHKLWVRPSLSNAFRTMASERGRSCVVDICYIYFIHFINIAYTNFIFITCMDHTHIYIYRSIFYSSYTGVVIQECLYMMVEQNLFSDPQRVTCFDFELRLLSAKWPSVMSHQRAWETKSTYQKMAWVSHRTLISHYVLTIDYNA